MILLIVLCGYFFGQFHELVKGQAVGMRHVVDLIDDLCAILFQKLLCLSLAQLLFAGDVSYGDNGGCVSVVLDDPQMIDISIYCSGHVLFRGFFLLFKFLLSLNLESRGFYSLPSLLLKMYRFDILNCGGSVHFLSFCDWRGAGLPRGVRPDTLRPARKGYVWILRWISHKNSSIFLWCLAMSNVASA